MSAILNFFQSLTLTPDQEQAALALESFLSGNNNIFILKGYAGTGKTTMLSGLCNYLTSKNRDFSLMAPTGRAAKILQDKTGKAATTIHKAIYNFDKLETVPDTVGNKDEIHDGFKFYYSLRSADDITGQVFLIDEASLVSDNYSDAEFFRFGSGYLLTDLLEYAKIGKELVNTKLILVGDPAQLPPVGMSFSPALDEKYLTQKFALTLTSSELTQVVRQGGESGVLAIATNLRKEIVSGTFNNFRLNENGTDVHYIKDNSFWDTYQNAASSKIIIAYKNRTVQKLNQEWRERLYGPNPALLVPNDTIIVSMNNYTLGLTNGTFAQVLEVGEIETRQVYIQGSKPVELKWQTLTLQVGHDEGNLEPISTKVLLNFLETNNSNLTSDEMRALFIDFKNRMSKKGIKPKTFEFGGHLKMDVYFNALRIKHAYAVTYHKAQGGEWEDVFTVWDYSNSGGNENNDALVGNQSGKGLSNSGFYRWAYTAITRATERLYAANLPNVSPYSKMNWIDKQAISNFPNPVENEINTIAWGTEEEMLIKLLGLSESEVFIKHKIAEIWHRLKNTGIEIYSVKSTKFLETIIIQQGAISCQLLLNYNGKGEFTKRRFEKSDPALQKNIETALDGGKIYKFSEQPDNTNIEPIVGLTYLPDAGKPFIQSLYSDMVEAVEAEGITIQSITPLQYCERYVFIRNSEKATIDFTYNSDGFYTQVKLVGGNNSSQLVNTIKQKVLEF